MKQHFQNDAERAAALKRSRYIVLSILVVIIIVMVFTAYKTFIK